MEAPSPYSYLQAPFPTMEKKMGRVGVGRSCVLINPADPTPLHGLYTLYGLYSTGKKGGLVYNPYNPLFS
jgi:hypothetical protein